MFLSSAPAAALSAGHRLSRTTPQSEPIFGKDYAQIESDRASLARAIGRAALYVEMM
jgi:hypothetical protein